MTRRYHVVQRTDTGRMTQIFKPANPTNASVTNTYDTLNRIESQANALSETWNYYFAGSRSEEDDPSLNAHVIYYNSQSKPLRDIDAVGDETDSKYDGLNRLVEKRMPEGNRVQYTYDSKNNILMQTALPKPGSTLAPLTTTYSYDPSWNKLSTKTDPLNNMWSFLYDPTTSNLVTLTEPTNAGVSAVKSYTYNGLGQLLTETDETGKVTQYTYNDGVDETLLSKVVDYGSGAHLNLTTYYGYDSFGDVTSMADPNGNEWDYEFDNLRQKTQDTSPDPFDFVINYTYDNDGDLLTTSKQTDDPMVWQTTTNTYTLTDKIYTSADPSSNTTTYSYDGNDRLQQVEDPNYNVTVYAYDPMSRIYTVRDDYYILRTNVYAPNGQLSQVTDSLGHTTAYVRDGFDRSVRTNYADGTYEAVTSYDANGNPLVQRTRSGDNSTNSYDNLNRLKTRLPQGLALISYSYDLAGRRTEVSTPVVSGDPSTGALDFTYDTAGRLMQESYPDSKTVTYGLDDNGNVTTLATSDGYSATKVYDEMGRLTSVTGGGGTATIAYDTLSRKQTVTFGNGATVNYGFALNNDLTSLEHDFVGSSVEFDYGYDSTHTVNDLTVSDGSYLWHPPAVVTNYYDPVTPVNQYPVVGGVTFTYDSSGNLTSDGTWTYTYNMKNQLTSAAISGTEADFVYDPLNRQTQKSVTTTGTTKTRYLYAGWQRLADYDGTTGDLQTSYYYGAGLDEPLFQVAGSTVTYLHGNNQGSVVATSDGSSGAASSAIVYGPFGDTPALAGTTFGYTGQRFDAETGLYYYKNRYYSPAIGRFLQSDPAGYVNGLNSYTYVGNSPMLNTDSMGLADDGGWGNNHDGYTGGDWGNGPGEQPIGIYNSLTDFSNAAYDAARAALEAALSQAAADWAQQQALEEARRFIQGQITSGNWVPPPYNSAPPLPYGFDPSVLDRITPVPGTEFLPFATPLGGPGKWPGAEINGSDAGNYGFGYVLARKGWNKPMTLWFSGMAQLTLNLRTRNYGEGSVWPPVFPFNDFTDDLRWVGRGWNDGSISPGGHFGGATPQ